MNPSMELRTVGEVVRTLRIRRGLEQVELAKHCGWRDASAVSRIETDRVHPTRRTLMKLAQGLAGEDEQVALRIRALLFLVAGIPPTTADVDQLELPSIEESPVPTALVDFAWTVWHANGAMRRLMGLSGPTRGKHLLELVFDANGAARRALGDEWAAMAHCAAECFRLDTAERETQRWYRLLMRKLDRLPDLRSFLSTNGHVRATGIAYRWEIEGPRGTSWAAHTLPLARDPRFRLVTVEPANAAASRGLSSRLDTTIDVSAMAPSLA